MGRIDRIYVSEPDYTSITVVTSTGKSDHKAIIAYTGSPLKTANKTTRVGHSWRFGDVLQANTRCCWVSLDISFDTCNDIQTNFDDFYQILLCLLDRFYPQRKITITSTDPWLYHFDCQITAAAQKPIDESWPRGGSWSTDEASQRRHNKTKHCTAAARQHKEVCEGTLGESPPAYKVRRQSRFSATAGADNSGPKCCVLQLDRRC